MIKVLQLHIHVMLYNKLKHTNESLEHEHMHVWFPKYYLNSHTRQKH